MAPAAPATEPQWPPRSPHEALLSTPGGRQRYRQMLETSPSPSPSRRSRNAPAVNILQQMAGDDDEEEDEETLQLKLQEIQARLKLKKLQSAKTKKTQGDDVFESGSSGLAASAQVRSRPARGTTPGFDENTRPISQPRHVEVPASPVRKAPPPQLQTSPSRVLLGIDKGLKAKDISLKRAPSLRKTADNETTQPGGYLRRTRTPNPVIDNPKPPQPMSFNERLAAVRTDEATRAERQQRIQQMRTDTFSITQEEIERYKQKAVEIPDDPLTAPTFSRDEIMSQTSSGLPQSNTAPSLSTISMEDDSTAFSLPTTKAPRKQKLAPGDVPEEETSAFEPYSSFHLSKRILPHSVLARHVSGKKVFTIPQLLKQVKSPDYALPDIEQDIVVFGILAKKSEPRARKARLGKNGIKGEEPGKFMVMTLVDLKWELDLFLFDSGFTRFWKLTEGTVIAILNPNILPPPPGRQDTGKFSLVINSDGDTIIEIGTARDLGGCQSLKKDGQLCAAWINQKRTKFCEFHSNQAIKKQQASRIEMNQSGYGARNTNSRRLYNYHEKKKTENYDWETKTRWFTSQSMSAADLLDGKDRTLVDQKERAEFVKRGLEAKEKERDMMKKLGKIGNSAGREYMEYSGANGLTSSISSSQASSFYPNADQPRQDAKSLGLLSKNNAIHLSPIKRKRADSSQAGSLAGSSRSYGWGSNLKDKLSKMKDGEKLRKEEEQPPMRKKTRFVTEKGIREAGRESLGDDLAQRLVTLDDDDDDELVIVK
ncbi:Fc.00g060710.m01.CDS01 [Cosmosporella sp. VM-42]